MQPTVVAEAATRLAGVVQHTPVFTSRLLNEWLGASVYCKAEHLQHVGAFKFRGASNAVLKLGAQQAARGVAAHSSGNHAAALARAAQLNGIAAHIVMPSNAPGVKRAAVDAYGASITICEPNEAARMAALRSVCEETGAIEIHPFDNDDVIAGAGTAALELIQEVGELDAIIAPVGGGGLLSGTCFAAELARRSMLVYGAEPSGADDAARSFALGKLVPQTFPNTICDGLLTSLAPRTFEIIQRRVHDIITIDDDATRRALSFLWTRTKQLVEPSSAVAIAAIRKHPELRGKRVGVILSGGNVDTSQFATLFESTPAAN